MEENKVILDGCDVVLFCDETCARLNGQLMLVSRLVKTGCVSLGSRTLVTDKQLFSDDGVRCIVLQPFGEGWQKGTLKFRVEFTPDELPEKEEYSLPSYSEENFDKEWD